MRNLLQNALKVRNATKNSTYVRHLSKVYEEAEADTCEVAYFIEQVTGHVIPDFRYALQNGLEALIEQRRKLTYETAERRRNQYNGMCLLKPRLFWLKDIKSLLELAGSGSEDEKDATLMATPLPRCPARASMRLYNPLLFYGRPCAWSRHQIPLPFR